ncbi:thymidylate kinase [Haloarcula tailed virus 2]|uniref:dTMP kinase n=1 Tax=Haloarcula tailed virus 2 TaxID=2877989 RepID=A0AAE8XZW0_9CAUD|nr:thymidylate kinase [Haloarcula tailed virus 2]UBF23212.1 thymidylate kinase [Haloarcula tailed virus 2]
MFVSLEGIDNSGKTTVIEQVKKALWRNGFETTLTSEPSEHWTGKNVRKAIDSETQEHPVTAFFMFMADRNKHIQETIKPSLSEGHICLSDRFADSTRVYQRHALDGHVANPDAFIEQVMQDWSIEPDLTIYLDITPEESMARGGGGDVYENVEFLEGVRDDYKKLAEDNERIVTVDAMQPVTKVVSECVSIIVKESLRRELLDEVGL